MPLKLSTARTFKVLGDHDLEAPGMYCVSLGCSIVGEIRLRGSLRTWEIGEEVEEVNGLGVGHCRLWVFLKDMKDAREVCTLTRQSLDLVDRRLFRSGARPPVGFLGKDGRSELKLAQSWDHGFKGVGDGMCWLIEPIRE
jgi:hypothetical protein